MKTLSITLTEVHTSEGIVRTTSPECSVMIKVQDTSYKSVSGMAEVMLPLQLPPPLLLLLLADSERVHVPSVASCNISKTVRQKDGLTVLQMMRLQLQNK